MRLTSEVLASSNEILAAHAALVSRVKASQERHHQLVRALGFNSLESPARSRSPSPTPPASPVLSPPVRSVRQDLPPAKRARAARYASYIPEEETIRNDYSQRYVDGGDWPQNWVLGAEPERRFEEYPKQQRLLALKKASVENHSTPSTYLPQSAIDTLFPSKFDVILVDPPFSSSFGWDDLQNLPVPQLAADPSFVFLWVGSGAGDGLERGREVLANWGYRRCEDVVWVKTNIHSNTGPGTDPPTTSLLTRTKQHCLMGIKGTVRRSTDNWFAHCNVDTDVIIWEGDPLEPQRKPPEMYTLIENFCLGTRRLELFGRASSSLRRGWVTVLGEGELERGVGASVPWNREAWDSAIQHLANGGPCVVPGTAEIEILRPKSPIRGGHSNRGGGGSGRGGFQQGGGHVPHHQHMAPQHQQQQVMPAMMNMGMGGGMDPSNAGWMMPLPMMMQNAMQQQQPQPPSFNPQFMPPQFAAQFGMGTMPWMQQQQQQGQQPFMPQPGQQQQQQHGQFMLGQFMPMDPFGGGGGGQQGQYGQGQFGAGNGQQPHWNAGF